MSSIETDERGLLTACGACGQKNRVVFESLGAPIRCGKCKQELVATAVPLEIQSAEDFDRIVAHAAIPVVVDYWAPWCGPCRMVAPELAKVASRAAGRLLVVKVNTDALAELGERFRIRSIPTMAVFSGGREIGRTTGARPAADIEAFIGQTLQHPGAGT